VSPSPSDWIRLHSNSFTAEIDPQGAQLSVLRDAAGRDLLWHGDPDVWKGRAPILFPIVGALNDGHYNWHGQRFALPRHGFARDRRFAVVKCNPHEAVFRQTADADTRKAYPFAFELDVEFRIEGCHLTIMASVHNTGAAPLPASLGFHPALCWPLPYGAARGEHHIEFEQDEPAPIRRLDAQGLLTSSPQATPVRGRRLPLDDALFTDDVIIFDRLRSSGLTYGAATGPRIGMSFSEPTHLGLWTRPGAGFLCIEPWRGVADPVGFEGEFDRKPGVFLVPPGASQSLTMRIEVLE
jgi:galactose mutarotase-like enzyme